MFQNGSIVDCSVNFSFVDHQFIFLVSCFCSLFLFRTNIFVLVWEEKRVVRFTDLSKWPKGLPHLSLGEFGLQFPCTGWDGTVVEQLHLPHLHGRVACGRPVGEPPFYKYQKETTIIRIWEDFDISWKAVFLRFDNYIQRERHKNNIRLIAANKKLKREISKWT